VYMKVSDYIMNVIADLGVKHVFFLSGGGAMHLNDSLGRNERLTAVCMLHEQSCAIAAEAYARITEGYGACLVTSGPGGTNTITGLAGAYLDSTPVKIGRASCRERV
jgi:acetolactate synthase-1/2/3 large subunit